MLPQQVKWTERAFVDFEKLKPTEQEISQIAETLINLPSNPASEREIIMQHYSPGILVESGRFAIVYRRNSTTIVVLTVYCIEDFA